jgi:hydroxyquinol 1,2-dioxygenase
LTTQIFIAGDSHLNSDTTFAVVRSAIVQLQKQKAPEELKAHKQSKPFYITKFDFVLKPVTKSGNLQSNG